MHELYVLWLISTAIVVILVGFVWGITIFIRWIVGSPVGWGEVLMYFFFGAYAALTAFIHYLNWEQLVVVINK